MVDAIKFGLRILVVMMSLSTVCAQDPVKPRPSPAAIVKAKYKDTYLKITYSQPHKRGREIFGKLVPYGQVWRTGANEATEITITKDIFINNTLLPAGTYSLFTIPEEEVWTIIINKDLGLWGSYNYNINMDLIRFTIKPEKSSPSYEAFTISIEQRNSVATLLLMWDNVKISIPIEFIEPKQP